MSDWVQLVLGLAAAGVLWDVARRAIDARRFNQGALDRLGELERRADKAHEQIQAVGQKLTSTAASMASRRSPLGAIR